MELIEWEAAKAKKVYCRERHEYVVPVAELDWMPTIDAAPVVHGRWEVLEKYGKTVLYRCAACKTEMVDSTGREDYHRYCHICGARMDGGEDDG